MAVNVETQITIENKNFEKYPQPLGFILKSKWQKSMTIKFLLLVLFELVIVLFFKYTQRFSEGPEKEDASLRSAKKRSVMGGRDQGR